jgi:hypothetical protein
MAIVIFITEIKKTTGPVALPPYLDNLSIYQTHPP